VKWLRRGAPGDSNLRVASTNKIVCPLPWAFGWVRAREYDARSLQAHPHLHLHLWLSSCRAERGAGLDSGH